ncbi:hypothetical protein HY837_06235 [archaeon]|nr:hypothetical protein [archaeon]
MKKLVLLLLVIFFTSSVYAQGVIECTDKVSRNSDVTEGRKGLHDFGENINPGSECSPISAGVSNWWFKTYCGMPYKINSVIEMIDKMKEAMKTNKYGTGTANIYQGARKFLNEQMPSCFDIKMMFCEDKDFFIFEAPEKRAYDPSTWTEPGTWYNPFSWFRRYKEEQVNPKDVLESSDSFIHSCPKIKDIEELLKQHADIIALIQDSFSLLNPNSNFKPYYHAVTVDGISENKVLINSNGEPAELEYDPLFSDETMYVTFNYRNKPKTGLGFEMPFIVRSIFAVIPTEECKAKYPCPPVDYTPSSVLPQTPIPEEEQTTKKDLETAYIIQQEKQKDSCPVQVDYVIW